MLQSEESQRLRSSNALICFGISTVLALLYLWARVGVSGDSLWPVVSALGFSGFLLFFPNLLFSSGKFGQIPALIDFYTLLILIGVGLLIPPSLTGACVFGLISWAVILFGLARSFKRTSIFLNSLLIFLIGSAVASLVWAQGYLSPLFLEKLELGRFNSLRYGNPDSLFHSAIAHMISTYHFPSTGLNGTPFLIAPTGSHFIMASIAQLLNIHPLIFYQLGFPIIFCSFFLKNLLDASTSLVPLLKKTSLTPFSYLGAMIFISFAVLVPNFFYKWCWLDDGLTSESFVISLTFLMMLIGFLSDYGKLFLDQRSPKFSHFLSILLLFFLMSATKLSVGFIAIGATLYLALRLGFLRTKMGLLLLISGVAIGLLTKKYFLPVSESQFSVFALHHGIGHPEPLVTFYLFHFFLVYWYLAFRLIEVRDAGSSLKSWIKQGKLIDLEVVVVSAVIALLPTEIMYMDGNWGYFTEVSRWIALPFFITQITPALPKNVWKKIAVGVITIAACASLVIYAVRFFKEMEITRTSLIQTNPYPNKAIINTLWGIYESVPISEKRSTLLYIPKSTRLFWDALPLCADTFWLPTVQFMAPAITGLALLDGLPEKNCAPKYYGFQYYDFSAGFGQTDPKDGVVCAHALNLQFSNVIKLSQDDKGTLQTRAIQCGNH